MPTSVPAAHTHKEGWCHHLVAGIICKHSKEVVVITSLLGLDFSCTGHLYFEPPSMKRSSSFVGVTLDYCDWLRASWNVDRITHAKVIDKEVSRWQRRFVMDLGVRKEDVV